MLILQEDAKGMAAAYHACPTHASKSWRSLDHSWASSEALSFADWRGGSGRRDNHIQVVGQWMSHHSSEAKHPSCLDSALSRSWATNHAQ